MVDFQGTPLQRPHSYPREDVPATPLQEECRNGKSESTLAERAQELELEVEAGERVDGGIQAWGTLIGGFLTIVATFGYSNAFGVYQDLYTRSHAASASRISWIGSTQLCLLFAMALPAGKLVDMGYFRHTVFAGSVIYVLSLFMLSLAHPDQYYQVFLSQGLGMGIGSGLLYVPAMAVQAHHWREYRAPAMGFVITGTSIGGVVFPIMLNRLLHSNVGYAWSVRASAFVVLGLLIPANLLMSPRASILAKPRPKPDLKALLTDVPYVVLLIGIFLALWGIFFPYFYIQLFAVLHGVDPNVAFYTLAVMNAASLPGRLTLNVLARRLGAINLIMATCVACAVPILALLGISSVAGIMVFSILYGFFSGAFLSLLSPAVASLCKDDSEIGIRLGFAFFFSSPSVVLTGAPIVGALVGRVTPFSWWKAIVFSAVCRSLRVWVGYAFDTDGCIGHNFERGADHGGDEEDGGKETRDRVGLSETDPVNLPRLSNIDWSNL
ncbi:major facilitator superfamily domain-containing protein [Amylostereum chailletii]|nr:major facilitator superfamily domain-containing protein [Amylostereum chailletii]